MKRKWIFGFLTSAICLTGGIPTATAQYSSYTQEISSCQQCYSAPQYQSVENPVYESVSQPVYYESYGDAVSYQPNTVYQSPVVYGEQTIASSSYTTPVVSNTFDSVQGVYAGEIYSEQTLDASPVIDQASYSTIAAPSYSSSSVSSSSYPVEVSAPVYQSQSYYPTSQGLQTIQHSSASYSPSVQTVTGLGNQYTSTNPQPGLAQQKAQQAAQMAFRDHIGGGLGGAKFEGVGWSNQSPQSAIQNCCYWGQKPPAQIGVSKSHDGCWYACVLYH